MRRIGLLANTAAALALGALAAPSARAADPTGAAVLDTYANVAEAAYEDSWLKAKDLQVTVDAFLTAPGATTQQAAKDAWLAARVP